MPKIYRQSLILFVSLFTIIALSGCSAVDLILDPDGLAVDNYHDCVNNNLRLNMEHESAIDVCVEFIGPERMDSLCDRIPSYDCKDESSSSESVVEEKDPVELEEGDIDGEESGETAQLQFNGLYQAEPFADGWINWLMFNEDGTAITVFSNTATVEEVAGWFRDGHESPVSGVYQIEGNSINISFASPEINLMFNGEIQAGSLNLDLVAGSSDEVNSGVWQFTAIP